MGESARTSTYEGYRYTHSIATRIQSFCSAPGHPLVSLRTLSRSIRKKRRTWRRYGVKVHVPPCSVGSCNRKYTGVSWPLADNPPLMHPTNPLFSLAILTLARQCISVLSDYGSMHAQHPHFAYHQEGCSTRTRQPKLQQIRLTFEVCVGSRTRQNGRPISLYWGRLYCTFLPTIQTDVGCTAWSTAQKG